MLINDILSALSQLASTFPPFLLPVTSLAISLDSGTLRNLLGRSEKGNREGSTQGYRQHRLVQSVLFLLSKNSKKKRQAGGDPGSQIWAISIKETQALGREIM